MHTIGSPFLVTGIPFAVLHMSGKIPLFNKRLERWERGTAMGTVASLCNMVLMPLGPVALDITIWGIMSRVLLWNVHNPPTQRGVGYS